MPYSAEISRSNPSLFLFLIDQSMSMDETFPGQEGLRLKDGVASAVNKLIYSLSLKCARTEGVRDYYHVGVIGYGLQMGSALGGALKGRDLVPLSELAKNPMRIEERQKKEHDGAGGVIRKTIKFPIWFDAVANNGTPMCQALELARSIVAGFLSEYPDCFPPVVINITDGQATDGDPRGIAEELCGLKSSDGNVLLFNLHLSSHPTNEVLVFPDDEGSLPADPYARVVYQMSSILPEVLREQAALEDYKVSANSRGFAYNIMDMSELIEFIEIGTRTDANLR